MENAYNSETPGHARAQKDETVRIVQLCSPAILPALGFPAMDEVYAWRSTPRVLVRVLQDTQEASAKRTRGVRAIALGPYVRERCASTTHANGIMPA